MAEKLWDWLGEFLATDEEVVVPTRRLWQRWSAAQPAIPYEEFERQVLADERVELMVVVDQLEGIEFETDAEREDFLKEMEQLGFYHGPRVKLKTRELTVEHIAEQMKKHTDRMMASLWSAYEVRPEGVEPSAELLDIIAAARELQLRLGDVGLLADEQVNEANSDETRDDEAPDSQRGSIDPTS